MDIVMRDARDGDLGELKKILRVWVRDRESGVILNDEIEGICDAVRVSAKQDGLPLFRVATVAGEVVGMAGLRELKDTRMKEYAQTQSAVELVNVYLGEGARGRGVGRVMMDDIQSVAKQLGAMEILVNSGPRYKESAWGFYDKVLGAAVGVMKDFYGPAGDAPVWVVQI